MASLQVRITSPRWDGETDRWQMPGEVVTIREEDLWAYSFHAEIVTPPPPAPGAPPPVPELQFPDKALKSRQIRRK